MKTYLIYKDDKSDKFWQIETQGNSFTVTYGKTGTAGTSQTKEFDNETTCLKEGEKLVAEKKKKGYVESTDFVKNTTTSNTKVEKTTSFLLSPAFASYLAERVKGIEETKFAKALIKADWTKYSTEWYEIICNHWEKLAKEVHEPVGNFVIAWADGADESIEIDYEANNDKDLLDDYGGNHSISVVSFENFSKKILKMTIVDLAANYYEDFLEVKKIFFAVIQYLVLISMKHSAFAKIKKKSPYFITGYYWHDGDVVIIYDSAEGHAIEVFPPAPDDSVEPQTAPTTSLLKVTQQLNPIFNPIDYVIRVNDADVLCLGGNSLTHFTITKDDIIQNNSIELAEVPHKYEVKNIDGGKFLVWLNCKSSYIISVAEGRVNIDEKISEADTCTDLNIETVSSFGKKLFYYNGFYRNAGFYERKIPNGSFECVWREPENARILISHSLVIQTKLICIGRGGSLNFDVSREKPNLVEKTKEKFAWPKMLQMNNDPFFIIFEMKADETTPAANALTLFELGTKIKKVKSFAPKEDAVCWQLCKNHLWVLTKKKIGKKNKATTKFFCLNFKWQESQLTLAQQLEIDFQTNEDLNSRYFYFKYLHVLEKEIMLIDYKGMIWRFPV